MSTDTLTRPSTTPNALRVGALAGLVWFLASLGASVPAMPDVETATPADIREYATGNQGILSVNAVTSVVAVVALLVLVSALARLVRENRPGSTVPGFVVSAGALAAVQMLLFSSIYSVWLVADARTLGDDTLRSLFAAGLFADMFGSLCLLVTCSMVAVVSVVGLQEGFLSRPVAILGLVVAAGELASVGRLVSEATFFSVAMYVGIFGWFLWPAVVGADLAIRHRRSRRTAA